MSKSYTTGFRWKSVKFYLLQMKLSIVKSHTETGKKSSISCLRGSLPILFIEQSNCYSLWPFRDGASTPYMPHWVMGHLPRVLLPKSSVLLGTTWSSVPVVFPIRRHCHRSRGTPGIESTVQEPLPGPSTHGEPSAKKTGCNVVLEVYSILSVSQ